MKELFSGDSVSDPSVDDLSPMFSTKFKFSQSVFTVKPGGGALRVSDFPLELIILP